MNYKTYKSLTLKQQLEYEYLKLDAPTSPNLLVMVVVMYMMITIFMFVIYLSVTAPELQLHQGQILNLLYVSSVVALFVAIWSLYQLLEYFICAWFHMRSYNKWKKENNIVDLHWWNKRG